MFGSLDPTPDSPREERQADYLGTSGEDIDQMYKNNIKIYKMY